MLTKLREKSYIFSQTIRWISNRSLQEMLMIVALLMLVIIVICRRSYTGLMPGEDIRDLIPTANEEIIPHTRIIHKNNPNRNLRLAANRIFVNLWLNDSIPVELLFRTGNHVWLKLSEPLVASYTTDIEYPGEDKFPIAAAPKLTLRDSTHIAFVYPEARVNNLDEQSTFAPYYPDEHRIWDFNLDWEQLSIYDRDTLPPGAVCFPIKRHPQAIFVQLPLRFESDNGQEIASEDWYMLDTGSPFSLYLDDPDSRIWRYSDRMNYLTAASTYLPGRLTRRVQIDRTYLADSILLPNMPVFFDELNTTKLPFKIDAVGSVGIDVLKYFNFMIDLKNDRLILTRNHCEIDPHPHYFNNLGAYIDLKTRRVYRIDINSLADRSGVQLNDKVILFQNIDCDEITPRQRDSLYHLPVSRYDKMVVLRNKQIRTIRFRNR